MRIITGSNNAFDSPEREIEYVLYLTRFDKRGRNEQIGFTHEQPPPSFTLLSLSLLLVSTLPAIASLLTTTRQRNVSQCETTQQQQNSKVGQRKSMLEILQNTLSDPERRSVTVCV